VLTVSAYAGINRAIIIIITVGINRAAFNSKARRIHILQHQNQVIIISITEIGILPGNKVFRCQRVKIRRGPVYP